MEGIRRIPSTYNAWGRRTFASFASPSSKILQYRARAKKRADDDFKREIKQIRKHAEQETLSVIIRFHQRKLDRGLRLLKSTDVHSPTPTTNIF